MTGTDAVGATDLAEAGRRLLARWWLVAAGTALGLAVGAGWLAVLGTPQVSCAAVEVEPVLAGQVSREAPVRRFVLMDNELAVLESESVRALAGERAGFAVRPAATTASVPSNTEVLRVCVRDRSGDRARAGAAALVAAYRQVRADAVAQDLAARTQAAEAELDRVEDDLAQASEGDRDDLADRADELRTRLLALGTASADGSRVLQDAGPARPDSQYRRLVLVPAVGLGLLVGCVVALRFRPDEPLAPGRRGGAP